MGRVHRKTGEYRSLLLMAALACARVPLLAQEPGQNELFLGPSFIHTDFDARHRTDEENPYGGAVAWTGYQTGSLGIVLDGSLHYRSREGPGTSTAGWRRSPWTAAGSPSALSTASEPRC